MGDIYRWCHCMLQRACDMDHGRCSLYLVTIDEHFESWLDRWTRTYASPHDPICCVSACCTWLTLGLLLSSPRLTTKRNQYTCAHVKVHSRAGFSCFGALGCTCYGGPPSLVSPSVRPFPSSSSPFSIFLFPPQNRLGGLGERCKLTQWSQRIVHFTG